MEYKDINEIVGFKIEDIIDEELVKKPYQTEAELLEMVRDSHIRDKIREKFYNAFENSFLPDVANSLLRLLNRLTLHLGWVHIIFEDLEEHFREKRIKLEREYGDKQKIKEFLGIEKFIKNTANVYFRQYLKKEIENLSLPEQLTSIKKQLLVVKPERYEFLYQALLDVKEEIEILLTLENEELINKQNTNLQPNKKDVSKISELNIESATLLMSYLFDFANVNCHFTKKAEVIEFLTGFSKKQIVKLPSEFEKEKSKILENEEISEKFYKDMQIIRNYFVRLGLTEIVNKIDEDLGN